MYTVDESISLVSLDGVPAHSAGAPTPVLLADDDGLVLAYETAPANDELVILKFLRPYAHSFGPPNDEAVTGHPLAKYGLAPYGIFEVLQSPWSGALEKLNRAHPNHNAQKFASLRHFIFTFHDGLFECLATDVRVIARFPSGAHDREALGVLLMKELGRPTSLA
jgi:hypothetical protein